MVLWTKHKKAVKQSPEGQLLLDKHVSSTLMYELKESEKEIRPKVVCRESCMLLGANLPKIQDIWYYGQNFKKL